MVCAEGGLRGICAIPSHSPQAHGDFLERFKEEVIFQMSLKGEKVCKVEKDVLGISGMA